jgi:hypothetical protein
MLLGHWTQPLLRSPHHRSSTHRQRKLESTVPNRLRYMLKAIYPQTAFHKSTLSENYCCFVAHDAISDRSSTGPNLGEHTVRNYLIRIFDKLGISSRVELVLYALSGAEDVALAPGSSASSAGLIA